MEKKNSIFERRVAKFSRLQRVPQVTSIKEKHLKCEQSLEHSASFEEPSMRNNREARIGYNLQTNLAPRSIDLVMRSGSFTMESTGQEIPITYPHRKSYTAVEELAYIVELNANSIAREDMNVRSLSGSRHTLNRLAQVFRPRIKNEDRIQSSLDIAPAQDPVLRKISRNHTHPTVDVVISEIDNEASTSFSSGLPSTFKRFNWIKGLSASHGSLNEIVSQHRIDSRKASKLAGNLIYAPRDRASKYSFTIRSAHKIVHRACPTPLRSMFGHINWFNI
ncbi:hypothetical protein Ciccas_009762 [Cichlidogyrus casuarinus]|uniref:Uncharacterized protein n=1 Tax=Cichlidogyrus casuarinus TaxID=1844966 RepID=A0ABD2PW56_9PLAT